MDTVLTVTVLIVCPVQLIGTFLLFAHTRGDYAHGPDCRVCRFFDWAVTRIESLFRPRRAPR